MGKDKTQICKKIYKKRVKPDGADGRNRTGTLLPEPDFESGASTSSATPANNLFNSCITKFLSKRKSLFAVISFYSFIVKRAFFIILILIFHQIYPL